jgi:hypothetical protein
MSTDVMGDPVTPFSSTPSSKNKKTKQNSVAVSMQAKFFDRSVAAAG